LKVGEGLEVYTKVECRGLKTDKFGNLYFAEVSNSWIGKFKKAALQKLFKKTLTKEDLRAQVIMLYDGKEWAGAEHPMAIEIEREFIYWTQNQVDPDRKTHGAIHKAFTEPFVVKAPFRTYEVRQVKRSKSIAATDHYILFSGTEWITS